MVENFKSVLESIQNHNTIINSVAEKLIVFCSEITREGMDFKRLHDLYDLINEIYIENNVIKLHIKNFISENIEKGEKK